MKLLDEIVDLASSEHCSVATLLRKCVVLSHSLKSDHLKVWAEKELKGYGPLDEAVPAYRKTPAPAQGLLLGGWGAQINDQPIPSAMLKEQDRHFAETAVLFQPIAAYEVGAGKEVKFVLNWPANLVLKYESIFPDYALNRAHQVIPSSAIAGLLDTIKTRVLLFALELQDDATSVNDDLEKIPKDKVDKNIVVNIFGGQNVIDSKEFTQISNVGIAKGDWDALAEALKKIGLQSPAISELKAALEEDAGEAGQPSFGHRTLDWIKNVGTEAGIFFLKIGVEEAKTEVLKWIQGYLGS